MRRRNAPEPEPGPAGSTWPPLPGADRSGRVAVALYSTLLIAEQVRLRRGDCRAPDDPIVAAHPQAFRLFVPPPLTPE